MEASVPRRRGLPASRRIALALAVLAGGCAFAVYALIGSGESDQTKALRVLRNDRAVLDSRIGALDATSGVAGLRAWGRSARADAARLREESALDGLEEPAVARPARAAHRAMIEVLDGFGVLAGVDVGRMDAWNAGERQTVIAVSAIDAAAPAVAALDAKSPLLLTTRSADAALELMSRPLGREVRRLTRRAGRVADARRSRRVALETAFDYQEAVADAVTAAQTGDPIGAAAAAASLVSLRPPTWAGVAHARLGRALRAFVRAHSDDRNRASASTQPPATSTGTALTAASSEPSAPRDRGRTAVARPEPEDDVLDAALAAWTATVASRIRTLRQPSPSV